MRLLRYAAAIALCIAGTSITAAPASAVDDPAAPDVIGEETSAVPASIDEAAAEVIGPVFIRTGTPDHPCLNAYRGGTANLTPIILYDCYNTYNNKWYLVRPTGASYYYIRTQGAGGRCLNAKGGGTTNLTPIILYDCHATWNNVWYLSRPAGASYYYIRTGGAGHRCLNVKGGGTANLTPIVLYDCHATWNNVWYLNAA